MFTVKESLETNTQTVETKRVSATNIAIDDSPYDEFEGHCLTYDEAPIFIEEIKNERERTGISLKSFCLSGADMGKYIINLVEELSEHSSLKKVSLSDCDLHARSVEVISKLKIEKLDLSRNSVDSDAIPFLLNMETLTFLDLSSNPVTDNDVSALVKMLSLRSLYLDEFESIMQITDKAVMDLAQSTTLRRVTFDGCRNITLSIQYVNTQWVKNHLTLFFEEIYRSELIRSLLKSNNTPDKICGLLISFIFRQPLIFDECKQDLIGDNYPDIDDDIFSQGYGSFIQSQETLCDPDQKPHDSSECQVPFCNLYNLALDDQSNLKHQTNTPAQQAKLRKLLGFPAK